MQKEEYSNSWFIIAENTLQAIKIAIAGGDRYDTVGHAGITLQRRRNRFGKRWNDCKIYKVNVEASSEEITDKSFLLFVDFGSIEEAKDYLLTKSFDDFVKDGFDSGTFHALFEVFAPEGFDEDKSLKKFEDGQNAFNFLKNKIKFHEEWACKL